MLAFQAAHFGAKHSEETTGESQFVKTGDAYDEGTDLGHYPDGAKRTLTDEQVAMFRHSEIQRLLRERRQQQEKEADEHYTTTIDASKAMHLDYGSKDHADTRFVDASESSEVQQDLDRKRKRQQEQTRNMANERSSHQSHVSNDVPLDHRGPVPDRTGYSEIQFRRDISSRNAIDYRLPERETPRQAVATERPKFVWPKLGASSAGK